MKTLFSSFNGLDPKWLPAAPPNQLCSQLKIYHLEGYSKKRGGKVGGKDGKGRRERGYREKLTKGSSRRVSIRASKGDSFRGKSTCRATLASIYTTLIKVQSHFYRRMWGNSETLLCLCDHQWHPSLRRRIFYGKLVTNVQITYV